jgi:hypothetical protein
VLSQKLALAKKLTAPKIKEVTPSLTSFQNVQFHHSVQSCSFRVLSSEIYEGFFISTLTK